MSTVLDRLAFIVSGEKLGEILIGLPLYVTWPFSLTAFNIFFGFCIWCFDYYVMAGMSFLV